VAAKSANDFEKVKCDGQRPNCSLCRSLNQVSCHYETDRRQNSRISKEHFQLINDKVASLEQILAGIKNPQSYNHALSSPTTTTASATTTRGSPGTGDFMDHVEIEAFDNVASSTSRHQMAPVVPLPTSPPLTGRPEQPRDVPAHASVQSETGNSAALHVAPSIRSAPSLASVVAAADNPLSARSRSQMNDDESRRELFAYSALEFQKEYTYMAEKKFDLDGLDWETADHLFQLHFNHHHLGFLLTYRPAIMHSLATGGPHCNKLLLNAIYYTAALQSSRENMRDDPAHPEYLGVKFFQRFQSLLATEIQTSSTATIGALVSMGSSCVSNGRQTIGRIYAGIAYQMIVDLGLHVDPEKVQMSSLVMSSTEPPGSSSSSSLTAVDLEIQKRYVWGAYLNDRFQSLYFGRPPSLRMIQGVETSQTLLDEYEELEIWRPYVDPKISSSSEPPIDFVPQPARAISTRAALVRLAEITDQIVELFYTPKSGRMSAEAAHCELQRLQDQLDFWSETLPAFLRYEPGKLPVPPPIRFNLQ
jgi:hypothetical protein